MFYLIACPRIINRRGWGARPPLSVVRFPSSPVRFVVIHHGGSRAYCTNQNSCAAIVRGVQNYHMNNKRLRDIGYNFVVGEDGNVYEGRGWDTFGAHSPAYNRNGIGICIIGDFRGMSVAQRYM